MINNCSMHVYSSHNNYKCCVYNYEESMHHLSVNMHNHNLYACIDNYMFIANYFHYTVITSCIGPLSGLEHSDSNHVL